MPRFFVTISASQPLTTEIVVEAEDQYDAMQKAYDLAMDHVHDINWEEKDDIEDIDSRPGPVSEADDDEELTTFRLRRRSHR